MAGGALLALKAYNNMRVNEPDLLERVLFSVRQQAGVMAALSAAVFAVITALQKGTTAASGIIHGTSTPMPTFGRPAGALSGATT